VAQTQWSHPTEQEAKAYFDYVYLNDYDWMVRNLSVLRDKARQGTMVWSYRPNGHEGIKDLESGLTIKELKVEAVLVDALPEKGGENVGVFMHDWTKGDQPVFFRLNEMTPDQEAMVKAALDNGHQILQLHNPLENPLRRLYQVPANFTIMPPARRSNLSFKQANYAPGGHVQYPQPWYVKQPKIKREETPEEMVTIYRAQPKAGSTGKPIPDWVRESPEYQNSERASGRWWTDDLEEVEWYLKNEYPEGEIVRLQVPKDVVEKHRVSNWPLKEGGKDAAENPRAFSRRPEKEIFLSEEALKNARLSAEKRTRTRVSYEGDSTIFNFTTEAEAKKYAQHMDNARQLLQSKDEAGLAKYLKDHLPYNVKQFKDLFTPRRNAEGQELPPHLNVNDPIRYTYTGTNVLDVHKDLEARYPRLDNTVRSKYNLFQSVDKKFMGQRDEGLLTIKEGTPEHPLLKVEEAQTLDPFAVMDAAMGNIMRNRFTSDYKIQAVESWVAKYGHMLDLPIEDVRADPITALHTGKLHSKTPFGVGEKLAAMNERRALLNLLGTESIGQTVATSIQQRLLSSIYEARGQKKAQWAADHLLSVEGDPFRFFRAFAFHLKLGLFNVAQIPIQAQTFTTLAGIVPNHAAPAFGAYMLQRSLLVNKTGKILDHAGNMAAKLGWKKEDFIDSWNQFKKTGLYTVEGEHAWKDVLDNKMFDNAWGKFLDKGTVFFRGVERSIRMTAWNAAYREWRAANPFDTMTNVQRQAVLRRSNDLMVNMTRASSAAWQNGPLSVPTQFWGYQARLMDLMLGTRLTRAEKLRVLAANSLMYGVPVGVVGTSGGLMGAFGGAATAGVVSGGSPGDMIEGAIKGAAGGFYPWAEDLRKAALEKGINVDSTGWKLFLEGLPSVALKAAGFDTNISERYGPAGLKVIPELFGDGDKSFADVLMGASGSIFGQVLDSVWPMARYLAGAMEEEGDNARFPLVAEDFMDWASNISSVNNTVKMVYAINTGKYLTKNQIWMSDVTPVQGIIMALTGLSPRDVTDAMLMSASLKATQEAKQEAEKSMMKNFRLAFQELQAGNKDRAEFFMKRAKMDGAAGGLSPLDHGRVLSKAMNELQNLNDKIRQDFLKQGSPEEQQKRRENYINRQTQ
jgi:hypothetical protein